MSDKKPVILWFRRDLRLRDHPALTAAMALDLPVIPVFIHDDVLADQGAAPRFRIEKSVAALSDALSAIGSRLILRRGPALEVLRALVTETGAGHVLWSRLYDPLAVARDTKVKTALKDDGITTESYPGHLLIEPWDVETKSGGFYKVYTPFWKSVRDMTVAASVPAPQHLQVPADWPASDDLAAWDMSADMRRGAKVVTPYCVVGEEAATARLTAFIDGPVADYDTARDKPAIKGTSGLSENLTYGEISPRDCWHAGQAALRADKGGAETFLKEIVWREFAYHLVYHTPQITTDNWRPEWDDFPWQRDADRLEVLAWKQGRTGIAFIDAAMREMYVTGTMHNRGRMNVASYLTKHLMAHWRIGADWFAEHLIDWDPASNAMGWQWAAGSGPDAAPYFRIFNPDTQLEKFDKPGTYARRWIAEGQEEPTETALSYFDAIPLSWGLRPDAPYPKPVIGLKEGRERALAAYKNR